MPLSDFDVLMCYFVGNWRTKLFFLPGKNLFLLMESGGFDESNYCLSISFSQNKVGCQVLPQNFNYL